MAGAVSLETLRTRIRQRSDNEHTGSAFVTDTELDQLVNTSYSELYGHLVRAGMHMTESTDSITSTGATSPYDLEADFYALLNVYRVLPGGTRVRLTRHDIRHRPSTGYTGTACTYRIIGDQIQFSPWPASGQVYEVIYVPLPATLTDDDDIVDGVLGWEEYLVIDCAIKCLQKEEVDVRQLMQDRERILDRIKDEAASVEMTESWVVGCSGSDDGYTDGNFENQGYRGAINFPTGWRRW